MSYRKVRMGIDVGGTHTKAVAIDNATHEIIGKSSVKTTHDDKAGVAAGVVAAFQNCLRENNIDPKDVIFVAHSTTQATNALIEGDVAKVGVVGVGPKGIGGLIAKAQTNMKDINLGSGRFFISLISITPPSPRMIISGTSTPALLTLCSVEFAVLSIFGRIDALIAAVRVRLVSP